jgi:hypothetical protein
MKYLLRTCFIYLLIIVKISGQVAYFPIGERLLIGPENVQPQLPEQPTYYIQKYSALQDSLELKSKAYKKELKLGVPREELLLTYRDMRKKTKQYIRKWNRVEKRYRKHHRLIARALEYKESGIPFIVVASGKSYDSDSIEIELEFAGITWEESTSILDISIYETYIEEDNQQWEKVGSASNGPYTLSNGFQFKKVPYEDFRLVEEFEGCVSSFEEVENGCINKVQLIEKRIRLRDDNGYLLVIDQLKKK